MESNTISKKNCFEVFNLPICLDIEIKTLDEKYREISSNKNAEDLIYVSNCYKALRSEISRGEEVLRIFGIKQEDVKISEDFLEYIIENSDSGKLQNIAEDIRGEVWKLTVNQGNANDFAQKFTMYKYIKKSFLGYDN